MTSTAPRTGTDWLRRVAAKVTGGDTLPVTPAVAANVEVEAWLQRHGVQYAPAVEIPMHLIDEKRSRGNQARKDPIVAESVDRFAAAMRAGTAFPPIVCYPCGGRVVIIDGNNRQAAARKAGRDTIVGFVVADDTPSELIQLLTVEANAHHGVTPELSWRVKQAVHLTSLEYSDQQAADAAGITIAQLRGARAVAAADERARALRVANFTEIPATARQVLGAIRDEPVFYQAAKTALETAMSTEEIRAFVRQVKALPSEGARIEFIGLVAKERGIERATRKAVTKTLGRVNSPKQSLVTGIGKVLAVDEAALVRQIVTSHDRDQINNRIKLLARKVAALQVAMATLADLGEPDE